MTVRALVVPMLAALLLVLGTPRGSATSDGATQTPPAMPVQAVLFFAPTCGHCHLVITEALPPLFARHGGEPTFTVGVAASVAETAFYRWGNGILELLLVDISTPSGRSLFEADNARLELESAGVPRMDVGHRFLVGSREIPADFPLIVANGVLDGGVPWPAMPGLDAALASFDASQHAAPPTAVASAAPVAAQRAAATVPAADGTDSADLTDPRVLADDDAGVLERVARDPVGNGLAIVVLLLLAFSLVGAPVLASQGTLLPAGTRGVPVLAGVGFLVAVYLAAAKAGQVAAVCGPVGDCAAVQASEYSQFFGVPLGLVGASGYAAIGTLWAASRVTRGSLSKAALVLLGLAAFGGALSSLVLTFLEPFVIGATCVWCLTSALTMLALLWLTAGPAVEAWRR